MVVVVLVACLLPAFTSSILSSIIDVKRIITFAGSPFVTSDITVNPSMDPNTPMQSRPQTSMSVPNTNTLVCTQKKGNSASLTSQAVIFCAPTVTMLHPQVSLYGSQGHSEPLSPPSKDVETGPFDFIWMCVRGHHKRPQSQTWWGRCAWWNQQGSAGAQVAVWPTRLHAGISARVFSLEEEDYNRRKR